MKAIGLTMQKGENINSTLTIKTQLITQNSCSLTISVHIAWNPNIENK
jgi:hypothetical protein